MYNHRAVIEAALVGDNVILDNSLSSPLPKQGLGESLELPLPHRFDLLREKRSSAGYALASIAQQSRPGNDMLHEAIKRLQRALLLPGDINRRLASNGKTVLHLAARFSCMDALRTLLSIKGIDCNATDDDGRSPLHDAVLETTTHTMIETVKTLQSSGADVSIKDNYGMTPYDLALTHKGTTTQGYANVSSKLQDVLRILDPSVRDTDSNIDPGIFLLDGFGSDDESFDFESSNDKDSNDD